MDRTLHKEIERVPFLFEPLLMSRCRSVVAGSASLYLTLDPRVVFADLDTFHGNIDAKTKMLTVSCSV